MESEPISIRLADALPCAILRDGGLCGRPATVAYAWPLAAAPALDIWPHLAGCWALRPVCSGCVQQMIAIYADK